MTQSTLIPTPARVVIIGGGPGGYEAALVARRSGADVTLIERHGLGGAAVLTDVVPSKTLIATADWMTTTERAADLGIRLPGNGPGRSSEARDATAAAPEAREIRRYDVDLKAINTRLLALAAAQSADIRARLERDGVRIVAGTGRLVAPDRVAVRRAGAPTFGRAGTSASESEDAPGVGEEVFDADAVLLAVGATPRTLPTAQPDGQRILTWTQLYGLTELPQRLIVVGSGVTGAEFASAYNALGSDVVLVSSRDRVLPGEDTDAAELIEGVFRSRGMTVMAKSRAESVERTVDGVAVTLTDGRIVHGSHVLVAVGSIPSTQGIGLEEVGVQLTPTGHIDVDQVGRTTVRGVYAAGDCTGVLPLASVAAMMGRVAMAHALGEAVHPIKLAEVSAAVFTSPEIATVGYSEAALQERGIRYVTAQLPLAHNPRAKMLGIRDGFIKLFAQTEYGVVLGGVVVAPRASELIYPITLAVAHRLTVDDVASAFTVYPSLTGSIAEAARMTRARPGDAQ